MLLSTEDGWIISHAQYLHEIYKNVKDSEKLCNLEFIKTFFAINSQFLRNNQRSKLENEVSPRRVKKRKKLENPAQNLDQVNGKSSFQIFVVNN